MRDIAGEVRRIRKALGWNQAEFAEAIGASQGSVSKWERGLEAPRSEMLLKIQGLFDIANTNETGGSFDYGKVPEFIDIPLTGALTHPSDENLYDGEVKSLGTIRLPRHPKVKGTVLAWAIPRLEHGTGYRPGQIIFTNRDNLARPDEGEKVIVRQTIHNGNYIYQIRYYGSSERGFEWFTPTPLSEGNVSLKDAIPLGEREKHNVFPCGVIFASLGYESARERFWDGLWNAETEQYSNTNF